MNKVQLFKCTLEDIEKRLESRNEYKILMISALLRKLLLDGDPLVHQINREHRMQLTFLVNDRGVPTGKLAPMFWSIEDGLDPDTSVPHLNNPVGKNLDGFLKVPVILFQGKTITVKDVILHMAHVEGAIHSGMPKSDEEKVLKYLEENLGVGGLPAGIRLLRAIARVTIKGLQPLKNGLENQ